jgi:hypothetical protein
MAGMPAHVWGRGDGMEEGAQMGHVWCSEVRILMPAIS